MTKGSAVLERSAPSRSAGDVGIPGDAAGPARPVRFVRHHSRRRWLRSRLASRPLWRMPPDVQLSARLAFRPVRPALLYKLVELAPGRDCIPGPCLDVSLASIHFA